MTPSRTPLELKTVTVFRTWLSGDTNGGYGRE